MWAANKREQKVRYVIISVSGDGKILLWNLNNSLSSPVGGYEVSNQKGGSMGVTCVNILHSIQGGMSVKKEPPSLESTVLVGTEAGQVYKTRIKPAQIMEGASAKSTQVRLGCGDGGSRLVRRARGVFLAAWGKAVVESLVGIFLRILWIVSRSGCSCQPVAMAARRPANPSSHSQLSNSHLTAFLGDLRSDEKGKQGRRAVASQFWHFDS